MYLLVHSTALLPTVEGSVETVSNENVIFPQVIHDLWDLLTYILTGILELISRKNLARCET
jgi:hypothetical protein